MYGFKLSISIWKLYLVNFIIDSLTGNRRIHIIKIPVNNSMANKTMTIYWFEYFVIKYKIFHHFTNVQLLSHVWLFVTPWTAARQVPLSFTIFWSLLKFMSIELVMLSNHLILIHPPSSPFAFNYSQQQGIFQWEIT